LIHLRTLGAVDLRAPDDRVLDAVLAQPKRVALLIYLTASDRVTFHRRDRLLATFWPEVDESRARDALNQALRFLRHTLGSGTILARGADEVGVDRSLLSCDAADFRDRMRAGDAEAAMRLYHGDFVDGFFVEDTAPFQTWVEAERAELRALAARGARQLAESHDAQGAHTAALAWGRRAVDLAPDDERGFRRLLGLLDRAGDRAGALQAYEEFAQRLRVEYGAEPAPETRAAVAAVRRSHGGNGDASAATHDRPAFSPVARGARPDAAGRRTPLAAGDRLSGTYVIEGPLGVGATATVYLARDERYARQVAVKVLRPELAMALGADRFLAEIRTTAALQHPHILSLLDSGESDGLLYYVMPYGSGETLRARLDRETQLPMSEALRIGREVASALGAAHDKGIIHRDIKPENILLHDGHVLVADFGIALAMHQAGDARMTEIGLSLGTPQYMAPEQAVGAERIDPRADVYALGAVLYEMIAGQPPFTGPTPQAIVAKVLTDEPTPLGSIRRRVPPHIADVVHRALEKLPADRPATARELGDALTEVPPSSWRRGRERTVAPRQWWRARNSLVLLSGAIATFAIALVAKERTTSSAVTSPRVVRFTLDVPRELATVRAGSVSNLAISGDGHRVAFVADSGFQRGMVFVRALDDPAPRALPGTAGAAQPFFSPDGRWIGFWVAGRMKKVALDGAAPQTIADMPMYYGATWMRGGDIVFSMNGRLMVVPSSGGSPHLLTTPDSASGERLQQTPVGLPDGDHILYSSWGDAGLEGVRIGVASLSERRSSRIAVSAAFPLGSTDGKLVAATASGGLIAVPVDFARSRVTGPATVIGGGVGFGAGGQAKAALSSSGTLVYLGGAPRSRIVLTDARGSITDTVVPEVRAYGFPRFSPDGNRIVAAISAGTTSDVWLYDLESRASTQLTSGGSINDRPEWSPDGSRILFRTSRDSRSSIWWQASDMSGPATPMLPGVKGHFFEAVMTPDGRGVVYQVDTTGADVEYRDLRPDAKPKPIASLGGAETMPRVSPDGGWVAFVTDESGLRQVVVQPLAGGGPRVQVSTDGGVEPVWARDGRRIFFRAGGKFLEAQVTTAPTFAVTSRRVLFGDRFVRAVGPHANFDVSPDGSKFLFLDGVDDQRINVVLNWSADVREKTRRMR
jgi:serine/threonine-protein kinase